MMILSLLWFIWGSVLALPIGVNLLPPLQTSVGIFYAIMVGVLISDLASYSDERALRSLSIAFGLLCLLGAYVLSTVDYSQIINYSSGALQRKENSLNDQMVLRIFPVNNIVIGIIEFTVYSAAILPLCLSRAKASTRIFLFLSGVTALVLNVLVATRTCFAVVGATCVLMLAAGLRAGGILPSKKTIFRIAIMVLPVAAGAGWVATQTLDLSSLTGRFSQTNEDPRLQIWKEAFSLAIKHPNGGGYRLLTTHYWGHNILLDSVLFFAWPGLLLVLIGGALTTSAVLRQLLRRRLQKTGMALAMIFVGAFITMMLMPPMLPVMLSAVIVYAYFRNAPVDLTQSE
jgi:hypothetical protein